MKMKSENRLIARGDAALSLKGRDKDRLFLVVDVRNGRAFVTDGSVRKTTALKAKNVKHLKVLRSGVLTELSERIRKGEPVADVKVRRALASLGE